MTGIDTLILALADWLGKHGLPTIAGFVGGVAGAEVWMRVRARFARKDKTCNSEPSQASR